MVDLGEVDETWNGKPKKTHKVRLYWQIDEPMEGGGYFVVTSRYTLSFNQKSNLRQMVEGWIGNDFPPEVESMGFDVESLIGLSCLVTIVQVKKEAGVFSNVAGVAPLMKGMPPFRSKDYVRVKDRDVTAENDESDPDNVPF